VGFSIIMEKKEPLSPYDQVILQAFVSILDTLAELSESSPQRLWNLYREWIPSSSDRLSMGAHFNFGSEVTNMFVLDWNARYLS